MFRARLDDLFGATIKDTTIPVHGAPPQTIVAAIDSTIRVFSKIGEEPGWPYSSGARLIYREVTCHVLE